MKINYTEEEKIIAEAIANAREVQEFIWGEDSMDGVVNQNDLRIWVRLFQKRVDKIEEIRITHPHALYELRKRLVQQAALSIKAIELLQGEAKLWCEIEDLSIGRYGLDEWLDQQEQVALKKIDERVDKYTALETHLAVSRLNFYHSIGISINELMKTHK
jgi:hypothetical protein